MYVILQEANLVVCSTALFCVVHTHTLTHTHTHTHTQVDTKWKERKEVLEILLPLAQSPKITAGDYTELMKSLRKVGLRNGNSV